MPITMKGNPLTLLGTQLKVGDKMPHPNVLTQGLKPFDWNSIQGKTALILSVPSLDTSVCSKETARFNKELNQLQDQVVGVTVSMDLPFAQARWCTSEGVKNLHVLSDHFAADFGMKCGVLIKELRLLARAVFVVDPEGVIQYFYLCPEVTHEPPYDQILAQLKKVPR